jgi:hypothetical protein
MPAAAPSITDLLAGSAGLELKEGGKYTIFVDSNCVDIEALATAPMSVDCDVKIVPVVVPPGKTLAETIVAEPGDNLLAIIERERCAKIAESTERESEEYANSICSSPCGCPRYIADLIRSGK